MIDYVRAEHAKLYDIACQFNMRDEPNRIEVFAERLVHCIHHECDCMAYRFDARTILGLWATRN